MRGQRKCEQWWNVECTLSLSWSTILVELSLLEMWSGITNTQSPGESACSVFHVLTQPIYKSTISLLWGGKPGGMPACSVLYTEPTLWLHSPHWIHSESTLSPHWVHTSSTLNLQFKLNSTLTPQSTLNPQCSNWWDGSPPQILSICGWSFTLHFALTMITIWMVGW